MKMNDKLAALVDKCASTRGAPAAAELFQHIAQLLSEDVERDARLDRSLRSALFRVARAGAASRARGHLGLVIRVLRHRGFGGRPEGHRPARHRGGAEAPWGLLAPLSATAKA